MKHILRAFILVLPAMLLLARPSWAIDASVRDEAGFFDRDTITKADAIIRQIKQRHNRDLMVETFPTVPNDAGYSEDKKAEFFRTWADKRSEQIGVNGVFILITKDPGHIEIAVGGETQKRAFTLQNRAALRDIVVNAFKEKDYNAGLTKAAEFARDTMDRNLAARAPAAAPAPAPYAPYGGQPSASVQGRGNVGAPCFLIVLLVIGVIVVVAILRGLFGRRGYNAGYGAGGYGGPGYGGGYGQGPGYYGPGYGGGGGGFMRGMFGGLLGGVAGGYLYDKLSGRQNEGYSQGGYSQPTPDNPAGPADPGGVDTSWSSTGGDFNSGSDSSGPEAGGGFTSGDSGGGGGDSGGGGGDSGGGGGDSGGGGDF